VLDNTTLPFTIVNMTDEAVQAIPAPAPIDPARIAETLKLSRWRAAEDQVYPLVMVDPALYQQAVSVVAKVCEVLRSRGLSRTELLALNTEEVAAEVLSEPGLYAQVTALAGSAGLTATTLVDAALAQLASLTPPADTHTPMTDDLGATS
jgi:hypothetical protein